MVMTEEQKKAKERAESFIIYLYEKYYPQIEEEMNRRTEAQNCASVDFLLKLVLSLFSYLWYN